MRYNQRFFEREKVGCRERWNGTVEFVTLVTTLQGVRDLKVVLVFSSSILLGV